MADLFKRRYRLIVDTLEITELDIAFEIQKSTKREPNTASIKVWNLNPEHIRQIEALSIFKNKAGAGLDAVKGKGKIRVVLEAGYADNIGLIFRGDLRTAITARDGADKVTTIAGDDGGRSSLWARVNLSFPPGVTVAAVVKACAEAMGVGLGNAMEALEGATLAGGASTFPHGTVLSGSAPTELEHLLRGCGMRYSVQNGVLQVLRRGQPLQTTAVLLTSDTGLLDSPAKNPDGTVSAKALLNHDVYPGRQVQFQSESTSGVFRAERVKYTGDTAGDAWDLELECKELVPVSAP